MKPLENVGSSTVDSTMISLGTKSMGGGTISLILGYLSSSGFAVLLGIILTVLGFAFNLYFQRRQNLRNKEKWELERALLQEEERRKQEEERRRQELHALRVARLRAGVPECEE